MKKLHQRKIGKSYKSMWKYDCFADDFKALCEQKKNEVMILDRCGAEKKDYLYADVFSLTKRFLSFYRNHGLQKGDTVVFIMPNALETIIGFFAALLGGINYAPIPCTVSRREYDNWIKLVTPRLVVKKKGVAEYESCHMIYNCKCDGDLSWLPREEFCPEETQSAYIYLMTSGTTGVPKAMSIDSDKLWSSGKAFAGCYQMDSSGYRFWNYLPMSYLGGLYNLALIPLCCKGSFVISEPFSGKMFLNYWNFVESNEITALWFVPSILQGLLKIAKLVGKQRFCHYGRNVRISFLGTAPVQLGMKEEFEYVFGIRLYENFALSESTFLTVEQDSDIQFREQGSVGRNLPYVSLKIVPVDGNEQIGTIWIKTPFLFSGYLSEDGSMDISFDDDGYFNTNDLGYIDKNGMLVLAGRNRDIIKRGGMFISLNEIENVVGKRPNIEAVAAVPVKHDFYGETYVLCVIFRQKEEIERQKGQLRTWMAEQFVSYKMPEKICVYDVFPQTASGKIQKNKLTDEVEEK